MADADKSGAYSTSSESAAETLEKLGRKVANEVRYRVRRFTHTEPLTGPWLELLEPLKFLAAVAEKEDEHHRQNGAASPTAGSPTQQTVWEREEVCVRIIVEEGKINLMARCLREVKELMYSGSMPAEMMLHARAYEESLGLILRCALTAIECLQTLDLRSLLEHCAICVTHAVSDKVTLTPADGVAQEIVVIRYLNLIFSKVDKLQPDVLVEKLVELGIVPLVLRHLDKCRTIVDSATLDAYLFFFVSLVDTEYFRTKPQSFFATKEDKKAFAVRMDPLVATFVGGVAEKKKLVRPVSDLVIRWK